MASIKHRKRARLAGDLPQGPMCRGPDVARRSGGRFGHRSALGIEQRHVD